MFGDSFPLSRGDISVAILLFSPGLCFATFYEGLEGSTPRAFQYRRKRGKRGSISVEPKTGDPPEGVGAAVIPKGEVNPPPHPLAVGARGVSDP